MTTDAQTFAKLMSEGFYVLYSDMDEELYILKEDSTVSDMPLLFENNGEPITCDTCNTQLVYDSGDMQCPNEECEDNQ